MRAAIGFIALTMSFAVNATTPVNGTVPPFYKRFPHHQSQSQNQSQNQNQSQSSTSAATATTSTSTTSTNEANNQGNAQSTNVTHNEVKQAPAVTFINASPTAPCRVAHGGGLSGPGFGLSFGSSSMDDSCNVREGARALFNLGLKDAAIKALCQSEVEKKAMGSLCAE